MSKRAHDIFALMINFLVLISNQNILQQLFLRQVKLHQVLAINLVELLNEHGLRNYFFAYVKDEGANLNAMIVELKSMVNCEILGLDESFQGTCFGHAFSKACQYGTTNERACKNLKNVSIKVVQLYLQKMHNMAPKIRRKQTRMEYIPMDSRIHLRKLNILVKTRYIIYFFKYQFHFFKKFNVDCLLIACNFT